MSKKITKEIRINTQGGQVFKTLIDPGLVKKWWKASQAIIIPDEDGIYALSWGSNPETPDNIITARIREYMPYVKLGLSDFTHFSPAKDQKTGSTVNFVIDCHSNYCVLTLEHYGFDRETTDVFEHWENEWEKALNSLKEIVESSPASVNEKL